MHYLLRHIAEEAYKNTGLKDNLKSKVLLVCMRLYCSKMENTKAEKKILNNVFKVYKTIYVNLDQTAVLMSKTLECLGRILTN